MDDRERFADVLNVSLETRNAAKAAADHDAMNAPVSNGVDGRWNIERRIVPRGDGLSDLWAHAHALVLNRRVLLVQDLQNRRLCRRYAMKSAP